MNLKPESIVFLLKFLYIHVHVHADQKPKLREIQCISFTKDGGATTAKFRLRDRLQPRWKELAIALGFPEHSIATMEREDQPVYYLFREWLREANLDEDSRPLTWRTLITALRDANIQEEANTLEMLSRQESAVVESQSGQCQKQIISMFCEAL